MVKKVFRYFTLSLNILLALGLFISYLAPHVNPLQHWVPSMFALAYPYLLPANVLFVIFWLLFYWRYAFISLLTIVAGVNILNNYIRFSHVEEDQTKGIKVLTFNVKQFYSYLDDKNSTDGILNFIASQESDIICLQETKLQKLGELNPLKLKARFPGIVHCQLAHMSKWGGLVTFSSYPIVYMGEIRFENTHNMIIFTDIKMEDDTIRVYNCHLQSFRFNWEDYSIIDSISFQSKQIKEVKSITDKLRAGNNRRAEQIHELIDHIGKCPYKNLIVCGDFNDTPNSYTYYQLRNLMNDSFVESGFGVSNTFRERIAPYRIDYIFHSNGFIANKYTRYNVAFSDHYPISAVLVKQVSAVPTNPDTE